MTVTDWIAAGAAIGIKAFFALSVFLLCCGAVLGLVGVLAKVLGGDDNANSI